MPSRDGKTAEKGDLEQQTFYGRLTMAASEAGKTESEVAAMLGYKNSQSAKRVMMGDRGSVKFPAGLKLCEELGIDPYWLAFGRPRRTVSSGAIEANPPSESPPRDPLLAILAHTLVQIAQQVGLNIDTLKEHIPEAFDTPPEAGTPSESPTKSKRGKRGIA